MESSHRFQEYQIPSPNSHSANSSNSSSNSTTTNGLNHQSHHNYYRHPSPRTPTAPIPLPISRSEPNSPYPTTFVQADSSTFKQVVQMLTGSSETAKLASGSGRQETAPVKNFPIPPINPGLRKDKSTSKLYERRNSLKNFKLSPLPSGLVNTKPVYAGSPILSPSLLDFPSLALSPVTPLIPDPFNRSPPIGMNSYASLNMEAEEKAIARKGFYLHPPSPSTTPRESETPRLLPLFPVTSPKVAEMENAVQRATSTEAVAAAATASVTNNPGPHGEKPEKFGGLNCKRWQKKMLIYLTTLGLARMLTEDRQLKTLLLLILLKFVCGRTDLIVLILCLYRNGKLCARSYFYCGCGCYCISHEQSGASW